MNVSTIPVTKTSLHDSLYSGIEDSCFLIPKEYITTCTKCTKCIKTPMVVSSKVLHITDTRIREVYINELSCSIYKTTIQQRKKEIKDGMKSAYNTDMPFGHDMLYQCYKGDNKGNSRCSNCQYGESHEVKICDPANKDAKGLIHTRVLYQCKHHELEENRYAISSFVCEHYKEKDHEEKR